VKGVEVKSWRGVERRSPSGPVACGECGTAHQESACPTCGECPDGVLVGVLKTEMFTRDGARWIVTAQRDAESGGWEPVAKEHARGWGGGIEEAR
jgi:hypothetical protein